MTTLSEFTPHEENVSRLVLVGWTKMVMDGIFSLEKTVEFHRIYARIWR